MRPIRTSCRSIPETIITLLIMCAFVIVPCEQSAVAQLKGVKGPDCNNNGVPDDVDIATGDSTDCNGNGVPDECEKGVVDCNENGVCDDVDIANETSCDIDEDGIPDECQTPVFADSCPTDIDNDTDVDIDDLSRVFVAWNDLCPCKCQEDIVPPLGDANVGPLDLFFVILDYDKTCDVPPAPDTSGKCALQVLTDENASPGDWFGYAVDIDGDTAVVGALVDDGAAFNAGAVHILQRQENGSWLQVKEILGENTDRSLFGKAVAIEGDTLLVVSSNSFFAYERNLGGPDEWGNASTQPSPLGGFVSVALDGDTAVLGSPSGAGIYERNEGGTNNWGLVTTLTNGGHAVGISGDTVVVGNTARENASSENTGAAYLYSRNQGGVNNWGLVKTLLASDEVAGNALGSSVSIDGDTVIVGARGFAFEIAGSSTNQPGSAYIYQQDHGGVDNWGEVTKITASDGISNTPNYFGHSVSLSGDQAIVGSLVPGGAYLYGRDHGGEDNWGELTKLRPPESPQHRVFGYSVATDGLRAIVGDHRNSLAGLESGAASIFGIRPGDTDGDDDVDVDDLGNVFTAWGDCDPNPACCPADLDYNGTVDVDDMGEVFINWD